MCKKQRTKGMGLMALVTLMGVSQNQAEATPTGVVCDTDGPGPAVIDASGASEGIYLDVFLESVFVSVGGTTVCEYELDWGIDQDLVVIGSSFSDSLVFDLLLSWPSVSVSTGPGDDSVVAWDVFSDLSIDTGAGEDKVWIHSSTDVSITGGLGNDRLIADRNDSVMMLGNEGNDVLCLYGDRGPQTDLMDGGAGQDSCSADEAGPISCELPTQSSDCAFSHFL